MRHRFDVDAMRSLMVDVSSMRDINTEMKRRRHGARETYTESHWLHAFFDAQ